MSTLLVAGCAVGGLIAGTGLGVIAVQVPPAQRGTDPEGPLAPAGAHDEAHPAHPADADLDTSVAVPLDAVSVPTTTAPTATGSGSPSEASPPVDPPVPVDLTSTSIRIQIAVAAVVTAVSLGLAAHQFGAVPELAPYCVLFAGGVALSLVDIRVGLLPRKILYPTLALMAIGLLAASAVNGEWRALADAALGGIVLFFLFGALWWFYGGMGFGDVRLAGLLGAGLGWLSLLHIYVGFVTAFAFGLVYGIVLMVIKGTGRKTKLPFGPALVAGAMVGVLWGTSIINAVFPQFH